MKPKLIFSLFSLLSFLGTVRAEASSEAKMESERLMTAALPFAQQMLKKDGEFFPYGMVLQRSGEITSLAAYDGRERPPSNDVIKLLKERFLSGAKSGEYRATALVFDVRILLQSTGLKSDAIAVSLNHKNNYSVMVYFPYELKNGALIFGNAFAEKGESDIFFVQ